MSPTCHRWFVFLLLIPLFAGCGTDKIDALTAELAQSDKELKALSAEHQQLLERCNGVQHELAELQSAHENLEIKNADLAEWSKLVAAQFGPSVWYIGPDERPLPYKRLKTSSVSVLAHELNQLFGRAQLPHFSLGGIKGDTAYVRVKDDRRLTQEMGTTGATAYIQAITYTLTSLPEIKYVDFDFREGSHAVPGKYSR